MLRRNRSLLPRCRMLWLMLMPPKLLTTDVKNPEPSRPSCRSNLLCLEFELVDEDDSHEANDVVEGDLLPGAPTVGVLIWQCTMGCTTGCFCGCLRQP